MSLLESDREGRPLVVRLVHLDRTDAEVARAAADLVPAERARADRGTPAVRRRRILMRSALRQALGRHLDLAPAAVPLVLSRHGRPRPLTTGVDVNCSASGSLGVVAVAIGARVGIDIERIPGEPDLEPGTWLTAAETAALRELPAARRVLAATVSWTQKEAVLKGRGTGLAGGLSTVPTPVGRADGTIAGWSVRGLSVPAGWVASVATLPHHAPPPRSCGGPSSVRTPAPGEEGLPA